MNGLSDRLAVCVLRALPAVALVAAPALAQDTGAVGQWSHQRWSGISGSSIADLTNAPAFYGPPSLTMPAASSYVSQGDDYGARTRGYITPATSGLYTFWVSGDDETQLSLAPGSTKWEAERIAGSQAWTDLNSFDEAPSQRSVSKYLLAGQGYYVELLHKEGDGGDHASVSWAMQETDSSAATNWASAANGGMATQSTSYYGIFPAGNAIDGDSATFTHTNNLDASWLAVDFRQDRLISRVELVNRQDACQNRLSNFRVTVEDSSGSIVAEKCYYETTGSVGASEAWVLPATVAVRRVKVEFLGLNRDNNYYLSIGELRAFGPAILLHNWSHEAGVTASQSSTHSDSYPASNAIDGNPDTFNHTADSPGSSLITDLGSDRLIDTVELINRRDTGCMNRLSNFRVSILDAADAVLLSQDYYSTTGNVKAALRWELPAAVTGRKIKVELLGLNRASNNFLHLAELNVWGRESTGIAQRGHRALIPSDVMSGYDPALTDDLDDDSMPDAVELVHGLNPADPGDALSDNDQDGICNLAEIRANANPSVRDSVSGVLVDELWHGIPGDNLTAAAYKAAFTHDPDFTSNLTTTQAFAHGEQYVRRVRGYMMAPVTGAYQFWGAADSDVDFFLSTSASKFDRQLILDNKVLSWGENYDIDLSQKSRIVTLTAGQKYYFEVWHKEGIGGSMVSLAWKIPNGTRQLIPSKYLSSYCGDANDQDEDYLKDDYELANGLSITDNDLSAGSRESAYGDLDGDGLTNLEEQKAGTRANAVDSDGDSVSDYDEVNFYSSNALANDIGAFIPVATLNGDAYISNFGEWEKSAGTARQNCRRGSITYPITVPANGVHSLKFSISSINSGNGNDQYDFDIKLNGKRISYKSITILPSGTSTLAVLTPWLNAGETYQLELFVDNAHNFRRVSIDQLQILAAGGTDSNDNHTPDWVEIRLRATNGFDSPTQYSKTSPATVEGKCKYPELLNTNEVTITRAPNGRFFTEVSLSPEVPSNLDFTFENGAVDETATIQWLPTNLLLESNLTIRQGDSLLLTAFNDAENASLESYNITVNGQVFTGTADRPNQVVFNTAGTTTIQLTHTAANAFVTNRILTFTVLPKVTLGSPLCVTGYSRLWTHAAIPAGAVFQFDDHITHWKEPTANTYTLLTTTPENQPLLIRQGTNGPILGYGEVKSLDVRSGSTAGIRLVDTIAGYQILEMPVVMCGDIDTAEIRCEIIIGGVTYQDGTTTKSLKFSDFDEFGVTPLIFKKPLTAHSNCHRFSIWHNGVRVAYYN